MVFNSCGMGQCALTFMGALLEEKPVGVRRGRTGWCFVIGRRAPGSEKGIG